MLKHTKSHSLSVPELVGIIGFGSATCSYGPVFTFKYSVCLQVIFHAEQKGLFICVPEMDSLVK